MITGLFKNNEDNYLKKALNERIRNSDKNLTLGERQLASEQLSGSRVIYKRLCWMLSVS